MCVNIYFRGSFSQLTKAFCCLWWLLVGMAPGPARAALGQDLLEYRVSLPAEEQSVRQILQTLEKQANVRFMYSQQVLDANRRLSLRATGERLGDVLDRLLKPLHINYEALGRRILLSRVNATGMAAPAPTGSPTEPTNAAILPDRTVRGRVSDENGADLPGVNVTLKGSGRGTVTDADGRYALTLPAATGAAATLVFSSIGYLTREEKIGDRSTVDLRLAVDNKTLNEVVVTGYSTQSKRDYTGAVSSISADVVAKTPVSDVTSVLQGRMAGVTVDGQGGPGSQQVVRIRGYGTLGNNDPLYVIDGVQTKEGINLLNPNDIESIQVLKDAASAAIYGARGANGVIVVTTKRGKSGAPKVEYSTYVASQQPIHLPQSITPQQEADAYWMFLKNSNLPLTSPLYGSGPTPVLPDFVVSRETGTTPLGVATGDPAANPALYDYQNYRIFAANKSGTDWFREVFKPAFNQNHQLAVSGGSEKSNYAVSFNYLDDRGILLNTFFKRYSARINTNFTVKPWLRIGENIQFVYSSGNSLSENHTDLNVIGDTYLLSRLVPVYDIGGNFAGTGKNNLGFSNPVARQTRAGQTRSVTGRVIGSVYADIEPIKNLVFTSRIGFDYLPGSFHAFQDIQPEANISIRSSSLTEGASSYTEWRWTNKLAYSLDIGSAHRMNAFVGYESSQATTRSSTSSIYGLFSNAPSYQYLSSGDPKTAQVSSIGDQSVLLSMFGNFNYTLLDRYLLSASLRRDGSSKFGPQNRYGTFPSVSVGWRLSQEAFLKSSPYVNDLKLRASWGRIGNDAIQSARTVNQYVSDKFLTYYDLGGTNTSALEGLALLSQGNPALRWETNETVNLGLDASLFNNSVRVAANWFRKATNGLLYTPPQTTLSGDAIKSIQNIMNFTNKGVELEIGYSSPQRGVFRYDLNANVSTYRNRVDYIDGGPNTFINGSPYARQFFLSRTQVGLPIGSFYGYVQEGIFQSVEEVKAHATQQGSDPGNPAAQVGHFKFKDLNGDGVVDDADRTIIGNPHPTFAYGFTANLYYKNFDLNLVLQGVQGNQIFNYWRAAYAFTGGRGAAALDTWTPTNTGAKLPIFVSGDFGDDRPSSFFVEDGSYLRVKSLQLGYTLPKLLGIDRLRVYVQGYNLLTFSRYSGLDPEINSGQPGALGIDQGGVYPVARKVLFGLNLSF